MFLLKRHSSLWAILFLLFIQKLPISNWLLWDEPRPFFPHRSTLKKRFKELWHDIWAWGWMFLCKRACPWRRQQQPWRRLMAACVGAGSPWHLLLREFSRWSFTFYSAACSAPSSLCQKPSDQLVCWSCSQSRDSPSDKQMDICCSQWGGGRQGTDGCWDSGHKGNAGGEEAWEMGKAPREIFTWMLCFVWEGRGEDGEKLMQFFTFPDKIYFWNLAMFPPWQTHRKLTVMWK